MTEEEALRTCTGYVNYPEIKGYFPFRAVRALLATGKYVVHSSGFWGYTLRILSLEERRDLEKRIEREKHGGALDWLGR